MAKQSQPKIAEIMKTRFAEIGTNGPDPSPAIAAATEVKPVRLGVDLAPDLRNAALGKMKTEGKTARELITKWLQEYVNGVRD